MEQAAYIGREHCQKPGAEGTQPALATDDLRPNNCIYWLLTAPHAPNRFPAPCPLCLRGALRTLAASTHASVSTRMLRHRMLASVPPPITPARCRQALLAFDEAHTSVGS